MLTLSKALFSSRADFVAYFDLIPLQFKKDGTAFKRCLMYQDRLGRKYLLLLTRQAYASGDSTRPNKYGWQQIKSEYLDTLLSSEATIIYADCSTGEWYSIPVETLHGLDKVWEGDYESGEKRITIKKSKGVAVLRGTWDNTKPREKATIPLEPLLYKDPFVA